MNVEPTSNAAKSLHATEPAIENSNECQENRILTLFLDTIKNKLDDHIGQNVFHPMFETIFNQAKGIEQKEAPIAEASICKSMR